MQKQHHPPTHQENQYNKTQDSQAMKPTTKRTTTDKQNKVRNRLKSSREGRSSRSRSSSSYCQAGCLRRSTFKNQHKKLVNNINRQYVKSNQSKIKLFNAIQKFYTNLSSMPLDLLITHNNPENWLKQQHETCQHLQQKLQKLHTKFYQKQNKNSLNQQVQQAKLKQQQYQYYISKLQAVSGVLVNIQNNIGMLGSLYQQQLRNYTSNSSLSSCTNSKQSSNHKNSGQYVIDNSPASTIIQRQQPKNKCKIAMNNQNRKQKIVDRLPASMICSKQYKKQQSMYEIKQMDTHINTYGTVHNCSQDSQSRGSSQDNSQSNTNNQQGQNIDANDIYDRMLKKFNQNINKLTNPNINTNTNSRIQTKQQSMQATILQPESNHNMGQFLATCRSESSPEQHKMQSGQKSSLKNSEERTKRISGVSHGTEFQSISDLLALSLVNCTQNGTGRDVEQMKTMLKKLTNTFKIENNQKNMQQSIKEEENIRSFKNTRRYEQFIVPPAPSVPLQNIKPLLSEITQLKKELHEKNKQIENLLANQQQMQSIIELYKKNDREARQKTIYSGERIKNLENIVSKYQKQIVKYQNIDVEMRESLKNQVNFVNSLHKQKQILQKKFNDEVQVTEKLKKQIEHMKRHYNEELQKIRKSQSIAIEKMEIYKQKYYQIVHEGELKKIVLNSTYQGKAGKVKEIWGILNQHRKNLHALDDEQQEQQKSTYKKSNRNKNRNRTPSQNSFEQNQDQNLSSEISAKQTLNQNTHKNIFQKYKSQLNKAEYSP